MTHPDSILQMISTNEALVQQLKHGDLSAFDKLNLSFHELYAAPYAEKEACFVTCGQSTCGDDNSGNCNITCQCTCTDVSE